MVNHLINRVEWVEDRGRGRNIGSGPVSAIACPLTLTRYLIFESHSTQGEATA